MEYRTHDYPAKNTVREAWMNFLRLPSFHKKETVGLYLPGHENLEQNGYLAKGLHPSQLLAAESDARIAAKLKRKNANINLVRGQVAYAIDQLRQNRRTILFANLDFDGHFMTHAEDTLLNLFRIFPDRMGGFLAVTNYAARKKNDIHSRLYELSKFHSVLGAPGGFLSDVGRMERRWTEVRNSLHRSETRQLSHLNRELEFLWWLLICLGFTRHEDVWLKQIQLRPVYEGVGMVQAKTEAAGNKDVYVAYVPKLYAAVSNSQTHLKPVEFQRYFYYSINNQPIQTWFLRIEHSGPELSVNKTGQLLWHLAVEAPLTYVQADGTRTDYR